MVKYPLVPMQETQETLVQSLGWDDPLEKEMVTHSNIVGWRIPGTAAWWAAVCGVAQSRAIGTRGYLTTSTTSEALSD